MASDCCHVHVDADSFVSSNAARGNTCLYVSLVVLAWYRMFEKSLPILAPCLKCLSCSLHMSNVRPLASRSSSLGDLSQVGTDVLTKARKYIDDRADRLDASETQTGLMETQSGDTPRIMQSRVVIALCMDHEWKHTQTRVLHNVRHDKETHEGRPRG